MPSWDRDQGDIERAPVNHYIVAYRKDKIVWGSSPVKGETIVSTVTEDEPKITAIKNGTKVNFAKSASGMSVSRHGDMIDVGYRLPAEGNAKVALFSVTGKLLQMSSNKQGAGYHSVQWSMKELPAGIYMVRFTSNGISESRLVSIGK